MLLAADSQLVQLAQIVGAIGAGIVLIAFITLIAWPAWNSYGRNWERASALFLSLYVLVAMLGVGALAGLAIFAVLGERI